LTTTSARVEPAFQSIPAYRKTLGPEVADVAAMAGFGPDEEQRAALDAIFAMRPDNKVVALEAAVIACRQNLKTALFKMCALGWLYVTDQRLITWSAHEFDTAQESHRELAELIDECAPLRKRLKAVHYGAADKSIELHTGQRVKFKARTKTGSRGLSGDKMVLDEAFALEPSHMGSLFPTMSARPDPQALYGSSAGQVQSAVLRGIRNRGRAGDDPSLIYIEYTDDLEGECLEAHCDHALVRQGCRLDDERRWYRANPALGRRITIEYVRAERRAMPPDEFARERLGWWDEDPNEGGVFRPEKWLAAYDPDSQITGRPSFAIEVAEDRAWSCIAAAGKGAKVHLESLDYRRGTAWILDQAKVLDAKHRHSGFVIQNGTGAASLIQDFRNAGLTVVEATTSEYAKACGDMFDAVEGGEVSHLNQPELNVSVNGAKKKPSGDAFVWDRRKSLDISPLAAVTLAFWGANQAPRPGRFISF
jgi:phage terminase large subunit-like protein